MAELKKTKIKKKEWYKIVAGSSLRNAFLGETFMSDPNFMLGRYISVNLAQITNDGKNQNMNMVFRISKVENNTGIADVVGYEIMPSSIRRLVRKEKKKVELSFICITSDNVKIRIKPIMIIKKTTKGSTETALRKQSREFLTKEIQKLTYENLVFDIINYKLQDGLKNHLKKIYPLKIYEIKQMYIESGVPETKQEEILPVNTAVEQEQPKEPETAVN